MLIPDSLTLSLSQPSKMPCRSFGLPTSVCTKGQILQRVTNSVCASCYAEKGRYTFPNVQEALERNLRAWSHPDFVPAMIECIRKEEKSGYFRWFHSGDIPNWRGLLKIVAIAYALPEIRFWLPTKEYSLISRYRETIGAFPGNLTVRLSGYLVDGPAPVALATRLGCVTSTVTTDPESATCLAPKQNGKCLDCRACWDSSVQNVSYKKH